MLSVAIVAGEASGDASGAALARELMRQCLDVSIWGGGGNHMREAGVELAADFSRAGAIGIVESLKLVPWLIWEQRKLKQAFIRCKPDVFVPIDFGAFNVRLGRFARKQQIPVVYYYPPGSWRRTQRNHSRLMEASDKIITPFPWSETNLRASGADAVFCGHPMLDSIGPTMSREDFFRANDLTSDSLLFGLLPGSRRHEIANILPTLLESAGIIAKKVAAVRSVAIAAGSERAANQIAKVVNGADCAEGLTVRIVDGRTHDVISHSDFLLSCSGTVTLEAMVLGTPMLIVYRGSALMKVEYLFRKQILETYIGMPNIIAGREICPEFIADAATPEAIASRAIEYLTDDHKLQQMKNDLRDAKLVLGEPGGTAAAARIVLETAGSQVNV